MDKLLKSRQYSVDINEPCKRNQKLTKRSFSTKQQQNQSTPSFTQLQQQQQQQQQHQQSKSVSKENQLPPGLPNQISISSCQEQPVTSLIEKSLSPKICSQEQLQKPQTTLIPPTSALSQTPIAAIIVPAKPISGIRYNRINFNQSSSLTNSAQSDSKDPYILMPQKLPISAGGVGSGSNGCGVGGGTGSISGMNFLEISDPIIGPRRHSDTTISKPPVDIKDCRHKFQFMPTPQVTFKDKLKTGLETIGADFMRANGAISGFKQLKRAEEFKTHHHRQKKLLKSFSNASQPASEGGRIKLIESTGEIKSTLAGYVGGGSIGSNVSTGMSGQSPGLGGGGGGSLGWSKGEEIENESVTSPDNISESDALCRRRDAYNNKNNGSSMNRNVGYRLGKRKELFERRKRLTDYSLIFAVFGVFIMILDLEFIMNKFYNPISIYSITLKILIIISTIILISLIMGFHVLEIKIFSWDDAIEDWRIAVTWQRVAQMALEVLICSIQPIPGDITFKWQINRKEIRDVSLNIVLSLPMLLRLYLILRVILLHSKLFSDAGSRSIGAMNKVSFNISFVLKKVMTTSPGTVLLVFILFIWVVFSWTLRICEVVYDEHHGNLLNSMWLISVTFLSIGYGDIVPHTYCGRGIAIATGVTGSACTALVVAVFARRLELSRAEKHVIHFMFENQLTKQLKNYAANVLRETWLIYKYTKLVKRINPMQVRVHQRKFLRAIHGMRRVKSDQRKLQDNSNTLVDLAKTQSSIYETVTEMRMEQNYLHQRLEVLEQSIGKLHDCIENFPKSFRDSQQVSTNNCTKESETKQ